MNIAIGTCIFGNFNRYYLFADSVRMLKKTFDKKGHNIDLYNVTFEDENLEIDGFVRLNQLVRDNRSINSNSNSKMPFVKDIFNILSSLKDYDYFIFSNADIIFTERLIDYVVTSNFDTFLVSRLEIEDIDDINSAIHVSKQSPKFEIQGFDVFISRPAWWTLYSDRFPDYIYGKVAWDNHLCILFSLYSDVDILNYSPPMIYHIYHTQNSDNLDSEYLYNINQLWNKYPLYKAAWSAYFDDIVSKRPLGDDEVMYSLRSPSEEKKRKIIFRLAREIEEGKHGELINENNIREIKRFIKSRLQDLIQ